MQAHATSRPRISAGATICHAAAMFLAGYFPSFYWGNPRLALLAAATAMIVLALRFQDVRRGAVRGLLYGLVAGLATYFGMVNRLQSHLMQRHLSTQPTTQTQRPAEVEPTPTTAPADESDPARRWLPYRTILPTVALCAGIGGLFGHLGHKRRRRAEAPWD